MSKSKKYEVSAWIATAVQAKRINDKDIQELQNRLGGALAVERRNDGELIIYSSDPVVMQRLDALMAVLQLFKPQKIYVPTTNRDP